MPRKKLIDQDKIKWGKIESATIENKNCLQAELLLQEPLTPMQAHTLKSYCKFTVGKDLQQITVNTKNSWKGLIMACLSIAYCKYGIKITPHLIKSKQYYNTKVEFKYERLLELLGYSSTYGETDDRIEGVAAPPSWKPCYVMGKFTKKEIYDSFNNIDKLLGLDVSKSVIKTDYSDVPHMYKSYPASSPWQEKRWRVSDFVECVEGIALVTSETMDILSGECIAIHAPYDVEPRRLVKWSSVFDDSGRPTPLYGYEISEQSQESLCLYFPFLKADFRKRASEQAWIIFDRKHLGKWG